MQAAALAGTVAQAEVHMTKDDKWDGTGTPDTHDRLLKVLIAPITGGALPVPSTGITGGAAKAAGPSMGQENQRKVRRCLTSCHSDAFG